jgi:Domain of unknown function (DUF6894)
MPVYFFHLAGQVSARDVHGHRCANDDKAREDANFIAHRVGSEKPEMVREGSFVSVTNEDGDEIFQVPIAAALV